MDAARTALTDAQAKLDACLGAVRELARGIYPPVLTARGVVAAIRERLRTFPGSARVFASPDLEATRFDPELELAVDFCCLEALQNAAKHAPGSVVTITFYCADEQLSFEIHDDGPGLNPRARRGVGLLGMQDRLAAVGGRLTTEADSHGGTRVHGCVDL